MAKIFKDFVQDAKSRVREVSINEVNSRINTGETFTLVDVREDNEWKDGHLPGAIHLSRGVLERDALKALPHTNIEIIAYCGGGSRSALAADILQQMGYSNVASMTGGFKGWLESGLSVDK